MQARNAHAAAISWLLAAGLRGLPTRSWRWRRRDAGDSPKARNRCPRPRCFRAPWGGGPSGGSGARWSRSSSLGEHFWGVASMENPEGKERAYRKDVVARTKAHTATGLGELPRGSGSRGQCRANEEREAAMNLEQYELINRRAREEASTQSRNAAGDTKATR